jgi:Na+-driven multidrug efflux pump
MIAATAMRASGQQKFGAVLTFVAYFVFGIPLAIVLVT